MSAMIPAVYDELCAIARRQLSRRGLGTFATSELGHEAYLKLADEDRQPLRTTIAGRYRIERSPHRS